VLERRLEPEVTDTKEDADEYEAEIEQGDFVMQRELPTESEAPPGPHLVPRSDIPISSAPENSDLEVRPFLAHGLLGSVMPPSGVALAWTHVRPGQDVGRRSHPLPGILIVLRGRAQLIVVGPEPAGTTRKPVEQGDVITIPSNQEYGFAAIGPHGLDALHVQFQKSDGPKLGEVRSLEDLLARNETRAQQALEGPYFGLLRNGALDSALARARFRDCARVLSDAFQTILLTRQATCRDEAYAPTFQSHFLEELGHNELLTVSGNRRGPSDPILCATTSWFCHQMLLLDNIGKAVLMHLVLETAGYYFHTLAAPVLAGDVAAGYFNAHSAADEDHKDTVLQLLEGQHPDTYRRLHRVVEDGWDMFDALTRRIVHYVELERASS
jgi:mannose-6-phosphate isomerase-like protein (cupin superfamily)